MIKLAARKLLSFENAKFLNKTFGVKIKRDVIISKARRFLCIQMNAIGDAVMTQPAWSNLKTAVPQAQIDLVCRPHVAPLFENDPAIHTIYPLENRRYRPWLFKNSSKIHPIVFEGGYDLLIDFTALPLTAAICASDHAPPSVGFGRIFKTGSATVDIGRAYDLGVPYSDTEAIRNLMLRLVGPLIKRKISDHFPVLSLGPDVMGRARCLLLQKGLTEKKFIVVHPGAKWPPKRWPVSHIRELIVNWGNHRFFPLLVLGSRDDKSMIDTILKDIGRPDVQYLICDQISLAAAIIKLATLCVCNDSAAMHIASAVGTGSVSLFGPVAPSRSAPTEEEGCNVFYEDMFCSPCTLYYSRDLCRRGLNFCMHAIKPQMVNTKMEQILFQSSI
jgi:ADP-heptose:LPS heptosyltransferase